MKKKALVYMFFLFIATVSIIDILNDNKIFSEIENRYLKRKPKINKESIFSEEYFKEYEEYINDQFLARDKFIDIKSISEDILMKKENNGIVYGKDNYMFDKFNKIDSKILNKNILAISEFVNKNNNVDIMLVPYSASILKDYLPKGVDLIDELDIINKIESYINRANIVKVTDILLENKNEEIYYKTDHHWTSYGAYLAYKEYCIKNKLENIGINILRKNEVKDFYGTYYSKSKLYNAKSDTIIYYDMDNLSMTIEDKVYKGIYNKESIYKRDKYELFLNGNNNKTIIKNSDKIVKGKKLLVFKDSFANTILPFIANHYEETHVIDLRHYNYSISDYIKENDFDRILILYSLQSLNKDVSIVKIKL